MIIEATDRKALRHVFHWAELQHLCKRHLHKCCPMTEWRCIFVGIVQQAVGLLLANTSSKAQPRIREIDEYIHNLFKQGIVPETLTERITSPKGTNLQPRHYREENA